MHFSRSVPSPLPPGQSRLFFFAVGGWRLLPPIGRTPHASLRNRPIYTKLLVLHTTYLYILPYVYAAVTLENSGCLPGQSRTYLDDLNLSFDYNNNLGAFLLFSFSPSFFFFLFFLFLYFFPLHFSNPRFLLVLLGPFVNLTSTFCSHPHSSLSQLIPRICSCSNCPPPIGLAQEQIHTWSAFWARSLHGKIVR